MSLQDPAVSAYSEALHFAVVQGKQSLAKELLEAGANVNHARKRSSNPDEEGADESDEDEAEEEIEVEEEDEDELEEDEDEDEDEEDEVEEDEEEDEVEVALNFSVTTPVVIAVENNDLEMVKLLLEYDPNVNDPDANGGELPLVLAALYLRLEIVRELLAHPGIIANARDLDDTFALQVAVYTNPDEDDFDMGRDDLRLAVVELLVRHGEYSQDDYSSALGSACCHGHRNSMRFLLEHGADANHHGGEGAPPLFLALSRGSLDDVRLLIRYGATSFELSFKLAILEKYGNGAIAWLSKDTSRTILSLKALEQRRGKESWNWYSSAVTSNWDAIVAALWFQYYGPNCDENPPRLYDTAKLTDQDFKIAYNWMVHAVSTLLFLEEGNLLLPHLCRVSDPSMALELCNHTGKTPLLLAIETLPRRSRTERQAAARGINALIAWNPEALKIPHPETQRTPMTCAMLHRLPLRTLQRMTTCTNKKDEGFTAMPKQQDPITLLPNYLLVAAGRKSYSISDIYAFSRDFLPEIITSTLKSRPPAGVSFP